MKLIVFLLVILLLGSDAKAGECSKFRENSSRHFDNALTYIKGAKYWGSVFNLTGDAKYKTAVNALAGLAEKEGSLKAENDKAFISCVATELKKHKQKQLFARMY